ncbi:hypothetical protein GQ607_012230 [Colletotrichum asianum]|uniref:Uncharacterized protein n=1 Tax=Colletotrichum asianum TaxID=702518 RepID=A0A8H3W5M8_9PEZI|nr:hypothetical protein GQ607_012230 [Colletotrichum asianum]
MAFWLQLCCFDAAQNANNLALPVQSMCLLPDATVCHLTSSPQPTFLVPPKGATPRADAPTRNQTSAIMHPTLVWARLVPPPYPPYLTALPARA